MNKPKKYFTITIEGNDGFYYQIENVEARAFTSAYTKGKKWLDTLKGRTIEKLDITRINIQKR